MKKITPLKLLSLLLLFTSVLSAQVPTWGWINSPQLSGNTSEETYTSASVTDINNNSYLAFSSNAASITFSNQTFTSDNTSFAKYYLVKYDNDGNILWVKKDSFDNESAINAMTLDEEGNLYVLGYFVGSITLDSLTLNNINGWNPTVFMAKFNASGQIIWAKKIEATGGDPGQVSASDLAIDPNNNLYLTGTFLSDTVNFDNITLNRTGEIDTFLAKYDHNGNAVWARKGAGKAWQGQSSFLKTDNNGNVFVTGNFESSTMDFDNITLNNNAIISMYLLKYNDSGTLLWGKQYGNTGITGSIGITVDNQNNPYIIGGFKGSSLNIDGIALSNIMDGDNPFNIFITKYDNQGNVIWAKSAGGPHYEVPYDIVADEDNNIYVSGIFTSPELTLGNSTIINGSGNGNGDSFITKISGNGEYIWTYSLDGTGTHYVNKISLDLANNLIIGGGYRNNVLIGNTSLSTSGYSNIFMAKLLQNVLATENSLHQTITLYPNPTTESLNITEVQDFSYSVIDVMGRMVARGNIFNSSINVSSLPSGMYFLNINNITTKFIKE